MLVKCHLIDFYSQVFFLFLTLPPMFPYIESQPRGHCPFILSEPHSRHAEEGNSKLFNLGIKLSACFCHITLIRSSPTNLHLSTTTHKMPKPERKSAIQNGLCNEKQSSWKPIQFTENTKKGIAGQLPKGASQPSPGGGTWHTKTIAKSLSMWITAHYKPVAPSILTSTYKAGTGLLPILQLRKLRHRKMTGATARKPSQAAP